MDKYEQSARIESEEDTAEEDVERIDNEEAQKIEAELAEASALQQEEKHLDINLVTAIETDVKGCIRELKDHAKEINSQTSEQIGIIIAKILGWIKNREQLKEHIKHLLAEESTIQDAVHHKLKDENTLLHEKETESRLRRVMWGPEIQDYLKYEPDGITIAPMEEKHFNEIKALEDEITEAKENITECSLEDNISKLLTLELNKVYFLVLKEIDLFKHLEHELKNMMVDIEHGKDDFKRQEEMFAKTTDAIEHLMLEEISILDRVPHQLIELKKEDLLDSEHIKRIEELEAISDFERDKNSTER